MGDKRSLHYIPTLNFSALRLIYKQNASSLFHSIFLERGWQTKTVMCINSAFVILDIYQGSTRRTDLYSG